MREILFRGKRIDNGQWIYGNLLVYPSGIYKICVTTSKKPIYGQLEEVIPETVGQYIGLTDKNGTRIFDGDIVSEGHGVGLVEYGEFNCTCCNGVYGFTFGSDEDIREYEDYKIIGNIHDNPELLEDKTKCVKLYLQA